MRTYDRTTEDAREVLRVSWQRRNTLLACSRLHWSQRSDRTQPGTCVGRRQAIHPVSVTTVLRTSSEQDLLERHNHKLFAEHSDTRNCHLRITVLHACRNLLEPLCLLAVSSVLAAFIMAVLPSNNCGVLRNAWDLRGIHACRVHLNDGSCISCSGAKRCHRVAIGIHWGTCGHGQQNSQRMS